MSEFVQNPSTPDDYAANVAAARVAVSRPLGMTLSTGSRAEFAALSQADQVRLSDEVATFVVHNQGLFSTRQIELARARTNQQSFRAPVEASPALLDQAATFVKAYGDTFGETVESAGGIIGRTAKGILGFNLGTVVLVAGGIAILWFGAPYVVPKLRAAMKQ